MPFSGLGLSEPINKALTDLGFEKPTPIQEKSIPIILQGKDLIGSAQTGTGKTAAFGLPILDRIVPGKPFQCLILEPTRELAAQVAENFDIYAKHTKLTKALLIGGVSFGEQDKLIDRGVDVLIATPGRLLDHFERGKLVESFAVLAHKLGDQLVIDDRRDGPGHHRVPANRQPRSR